MSVCFELTQESENALAIKLREQILNKIKESKTEKELQQTLLNILRDNDEELDLEKIQNGDEVSRLLNNFLVCSLESTPDNLDSYQVQLGSLIQNAVDLACNPPSFSIPYPYPTIDDTKDFTNKLLLALLRLAINILLSIIKKLLALIVEICTSGLSRFNNYSDLSFADAITNAIGDEIEQSFIADVFRAFGIDENGHSTEIIQVGEDCEDQTEPTAVLKDINKFLDDLSMMATPVEVCSLLNNKANETTFLVVEELLEFEYPEMRKRLNNRSKISGLFKTLGTRTDPSFCAIIEQNSEQIIAAPELCFSQDVNTVRESLLKERNLTNEEIKDVLNQERQRTRRNLEKLSELSTAIKTNPNKILGETPEIFCKGSEPGLVSIDDMPSLKQAVQQTIDSTFNTFAYVYNLNSSNFVNNILEVKITENTTEPILRKFIDTTAVDNNGDVQILENSLNPKFMQRVAANQFTLCDPFGRTDQDSLIDYYEELEVNNNSVVNDDRIDTQTLINTTNFSAFDGGEEGIVYIRNYDYQAKVTPDVQDVVNKVENYISLDYEKLSISISIPNKYLSTTNNSNVGNFDTLPSTQTITLYTVTGSTT
jgi:hypothetical protein